MSCVLISKQQQQQQQQQQQNTQLNLHVVIDEQITIQSIWPPRVYSVSQSMLLFVMFIAS